jgi:acyl phosphate:glycerol-3-phosphate acyltransferase
LIFIFCILLICAYLLGSIPMAYLVAKYRFKQDIRKYGSGQVGASNLFRSFSKKYGILVAAYDIFKGVIMVLLARLIGMDIWMQVGIGLAVIIGHNWPVFLKFNAGRGLASTVGVAFVLFPMGIPSFLIFALITLFIGSSPLPALLAVASLPLTSLAMGKPVSLTIGLTILWLVLVIRRLTAPMTERSKLVSKKELYINRFLFDRDIRDGNAWIYHKPQNQSGDK